MIFKISSLTLIFKPKSIIMKQKLIYSIIILLLAACTATKTTAPVASIAGDWDYVVSGTPEGDFKGVLSITPSANTFTAKMSMGAGDTPVQNFSYETSLKKITGEVPYNEFMVALDAVMAGDELAGSISAGGMSFPFKATRKK